MKYRVATTLAALLMLAVPVFGSDGNMSGKWEPRVMG